MCSLFYCRTEWMYLYTHTHGHLKKDIWTAFFICTINKYCQTISTVRRGEENRRKIRYQQRSKMVLIEKHACVGQTNFIQIISWCTKRGLNAAIGSLCMCVCVSNSNMEMNMNIVRACDPAVDVSSRWCVVGRVPNIFVARYNFKTHRAHTKKGKNLSSRITLRTLFSMKFSRTFVCRVCWCCIRDR